MSLIAQCAACKKQYRLGDEMAGRKVKCKHCGQIISIPGAQAAPVAPKAPAAAARSSHANPLDDPGFSGSATEDDAESMAVAPPSLPKPKSAPRRATRTGSDGDDLLAAPDHAPETRVRKHTVKRPPPTSGGAGPDGVTPMLCLLYVLAMIVAGIMGSVKIGNGQAEPGLTHTTLWASHIVIIVAFYAIVGPLVWLGIFVAGRILNFGMPDMPYVKACGVAAVPAVVLVGVSLLPPNPFLIALGVVAIIPLTFYVLYYTFGLRFGEGALTFLFAGAMYVGGYLIVALLVMGVIFTAVVGKKKDDPTAQASTARQSSRVKSPYLEKQEREFQERQEKRQRENDQRAAEYAANNAPEVPQGGDYVAHYAAFLGDQNPNRRRSAASHLASAPAGREDDAARALESLLNNEDASIRSSAVSAHARAKPDTALPILSKALSDPQSSIRTTAREGLVKIGDPRALPALVASITLDETFALEAIGKFSPKYDLEIIEALKPLLGHEKAGVRKLAIGELVKRKDAVAQKPEVIGDSMVAMLSDKDAYVAGAARDAIVIMQYQPGVEPILKALLDSLNENNSMSGELSNRAKAVAKLGVIAEPGLIERLKGTNPFAAKAAAEALGEIASGSDKSLDALRAAAKSSDAGIATAAMASWKKQRPEEVSFTTQALVALQSNDSRELERTYKMLAETKPEERRNEISAALEKKVESTHGAAMDALAQALAVWGNDLTLEAMTASLRSDDSMKGDERKIAIKYLGYRRNKDAVPALLAAMNKNSPEVVEALTQIGPAAEDDVARAMLKEKEGRDQEPYCEILAAIGTSKSIKSLSIVAREATKDRWGHWHNAADRAKEAIEAIKSREARAKATPKDSTAGSTDKPAADAAPDRASPPAKDKVPVIKDEDVPVIKDEG
jgi:predicted Zn finger-like uncharacterized protein